MAKRKRFFASVHAAGPAPDEMCYPFDSRVVFPLVAGTQPNRGERRSAG
jgi:hypothetical protein